MRDFNFANISCNLQPLRLSVYYIVKVLLQNNYLGRLLLRELSPMRLFLQELRLRSMRLLLCYVMALKTFCVQHIINRIDEMLQSQVLRYSL